MAYTQAELDALVEIIVKNFEKPNTLFLELIGARIQEIEELPPEKVEEYLLEGDYMDDVKELERAINAASSSSAQEIGPLLLVIGAAAYMGYKSEYEQIEGTQPAWSKNSGMQGVTKKSAEYFAQLFQDLPRASAFKIRGNDGTPKPTKLSDGYQWLIDNAVEEIHNGGAYTPPIKSIVRDYADNGIQVADYESGYSRRMDSTVRQDVFAGMRNANQAYMDEIGRQLGCDGVEISAHLMPAADHAPYQGGMYTNDEFQEIQDALPRPFGMWNCGHSWSPVIMGVSEPRYSKAYLDRIIAENERGVTVAGKHYTMYEASQEQRRMETSVRQAKDRAIAYAAAGLDDEATEARRDAHWKTNDYKAFSKAVGLSPKPDRLTVWGY